MSRRPTRWKIASVIGFLAGFLAFYLLVRRGGHHEVEIKIDYAAGTVTADPESAVIRYWGEEGTMISREYRVRWTIAGDGLKKGHKVVITPKRGQTNEKLFQDEYRLWRGRIFRDLAVSSGFPRSEPIWEGYADPRTQRHVWMEGNEGDARQGESAQPTQAAKGLEEKLDQRVLRIARWRYNIEVFDEDNEPLMVLDPEIIVNECP